MFSKKSFSYISEKWNSYILGNGAIKPNLEKIKKIHPEKILIFQEMKLSSSKIIEFLIFPEKELSSLYT